MLKYILSFLTIFLISNIVFSANLKKGNEIEETQIRTYLHEMMEYVRKNLKNSKFNCGDNLSFGFCHHFDKKTGALEIKISIFGNHNEKYKLEFVDFSSKLSIKYFNKSKKTVNKKPPASIKKITLKQEEQNSLEEVIAIFANNLLRQNNSSFEKWKEETKFFDESQKLLVLQTMFQELIFTNGLGTYFPEFHKANNLFECKELYITISNKIGFELNKYNKLNTEYNKIFHNRASIHVAVNKIFDNNNSPICYIYKKSNLEELLKLDPHEAWSKLILLAQFSRDINKKLLKVRDLLKNLQLRIEFYHKYQNIIKDILIDFSPTEQSVLVFLSFVDNNWEDNCAIDKSYLDCCEKTIELIENNIKSSETVISDVEDSLSKISFSSKLSLTEDYHDSCKSESEENYTEDSNEEVAEPVYNITQKSVTNECRAEAKRKIESEEARARKKSARVVNTNSHCNSNVETQSINNMQKLSVLNKKTNIITEIDCEFLINNSDIFISFDDLYDLENAEKITVFLETAKRLKILRQDSLGKNGLKVYGINFLVVKNKKFPAEHLLFVSIPINNGDLGCVFVPHKLVSHRFYENLLDQPQLLESTLEAAREQLSIRTIK